MVSGWGFRVQERPRHPPPDSRLQRTEFPSESANTRFYQDERVDQNPGLSPSRRHLKLGVTC